VMVKSVPRRFNSHARQLPAIPWPMIRTFMIVE
jgi:hypothetical protein